MKRMRVYWENSDGTLGESARTYENAAECVELLDSLARAGAKVWFKEVQPVHHTVPDEVHECADDSYCRKAQWSPCIGPRRSK